MLWFKGKKEKTTLDADAPLHTKDRKSFFSFFKRLRDGLKKTRDGIIGRIEQIASGRKIDRDFLEDIEEILVTSDVGFKTTSRIISDLEERFERNELQDIESIKKGLKEIVLSILDREFPEFNINTEGPSAIMVVGVNGVGKTTTIGKLAHKFHGEGAKTLLAAGDTFRAAAIEQLEIWGARVGAEFIHHAAGADPSAVIYDAIQAGKARNCDIILADTAGRLHTKSNLMEELKKIKRIMARELEGAPHEVLLVLDATTGQNGIIQARMFSEAVDISGIALTKLDGTAKGGVILNIIDELQIPVRFIGIGEQIDDLRDFDPRQFTDALFE